MGKSERANQDGEICLKLTWKQSKSATKNPEVTLKSLKDWRIAKRGNIKVGHVRYTSVCIYIYGWQFEREFNIHAFDFMLTSDMG